MGNKIVLFALVVSGVLVSRIYAITVNPASSVTADSNATALTIPYRDSNGDFSTRVLTVTGGLVASGTTVSASSATTSANALKLVGSYTSTQLSTLAGGVGQVAFNETLTTICVSTGSGAGAWVLPRSTAIVGILVQCY